MVSGSFSLPFRGTFHLSLAVLVHYRLARVFSLIPWSGQIRTKFLPLCYLGTKFILFRFCVPDFHCLWLFIPKYSTTKKERIILAPQPPAIMAGFRLFRFRSPLLAESLSFSSPSGTWMFSSPEFPHAASRRTQNSKRNPPVGGSNPNLKI